MTREEMLKTLEEKIRKMNHEELVKFNAVLDHLERTHEETGEYPSNDELRKVWDKAEGEGQ